MATESFVLRIHYLPNEQDARELLEVALAGASLDIDLDVLLEGVAVSFLEGESAGPWRQLLDHGLARVWYCGNPVESDRHVLPACWLDARQRDRLLHGRAVLEL